MIVRLGLGAILAVLAFSLLVPRAQAWEDADVSWALTLAAERHGVSRWVLREVSRCESEWNPYAVGAQGEQGLFQLHRRGLLPAFYAAGHTDVWSPYQQADFTAEMFAAGYAPHWSCFWTEIVGRMPPWWT